MNNQNFKIYQVKKVFSYFHGFLSLESYERIHKNKININRYKLVYEDTINTYEDSEMKVLESIFKRFNIDRPINFKGHSMSVGDIVEIFGKLWYCDSIGWKEIKVETNIPKVAINDYLIFEHGDILDELVKKKREMAENENEVLKYISDLSKDFAQFCWEEGYEPQKVYFTKNKTND